MKTGEGEGEDWGRFPALVETVDSGENPELNERKNETKFSCGDDGQEQGFE